MARARTAGRRHYEAAETKLPRAGRGGLPPIASPGGESDKRAGVLRTAAGGSHPCSLRADKRAGALRTSRRARAGARRLRLLCSLCVSIPVSAHVEVTDWLIFKSWAL